MTRYPETKVGLFAILGLKMQGFSFPSAVA